MCVQIRDAYLQSELQPEVEEKTPRLPQENHHQRSITQNVAAEFDFAEEEWQLSLIHI